MGAIFLPSDSKEQGEAEDHLFNKDQHGNRPVTGVSAAPISGIIELVLTDRTEQRHSIENQDERDDETQRNVMQKKTISSLAE